MALTLTTDNSIRDYDPSLITNVSNTSTEGYITAQGLYTTNGTWWEEQENTAAPNTQPYQPYQPDSYPWTYEYPQQPQPEDVMPQPWPQPLPEIPFERLDISEFIKQLEQIHDKKNLNKKIKVPFEF